MNIMEKQMNTIFNEITQMGNKEGFDPKMIQAQIFLETGYLQHMLPESNNIFNIKWKGNEKEIMERLNIIIDKRTYHVWEVIDGKKIWIDDEFRVYQTIEDSIIDYVDYIKQKTDLNIYKRFGFKPKEYYQQLKDFGYQTDPNYVNKLMRMYNLITYIWFDRIELIKILQKSINQKPDGFLGPKTLKILNDKQKQN